MSPDDQVLVAALILLRDGLPPLIDELTAGKLGHRDRAALARALRTVAVSLSSAPVIDQACDSVVALGPHMGGGTLDEGQRVRHRH